MSIPPSTIGPTGCSWRWNAVTTPKLPPPPRSAPEQVGVLVGRRGDLAAVGGDHLGREQVVAREAELALEPAAAAPEREPGDAGASTRGHR